MDGVFIEVAEDDPPMGPLRRERVWSVSDVKPIVLPLTSSVCVSRAVSLARVGLGIRQGSTSRPLETVGLRRWTEGQRSGIALLCERIQDS